MKAIVLDINKNNEFSVTEYEHKEFVLPYHLHNQYEITLILKGTGTRIIGDNIDNYVPSDLIFIGPNVPHVWRSHGNKEEVKAISIKFSTTFPSPDFFNNPILHEVFQILELSRKGLIIKGKSNQEIAVKIQQVASLNPQKQLLSILEILFMLTDQNKYELISTDGLMFGKHIDISKIDQIISYIFDNINQKITAEQLADLVKMHPSAVGRYFKKNTGYSPVEFINRIRISFACRLLLENNLNILEICYECGFNNLSHFNRCFKKNKGVSPTHYRKKFNSQDIPSKQIL